MSQRTLDVLGAARDAGTEFVLATGWPPRWIPEITEQFAEPAPAWYAVCANGAIVYDLENDRILHAAQLAPRRAAAPRRHSRPAAAHRRCRL